MKIGRTLLLISLALLMLTMAACTPTSTPQTKTAAPTATQTPTEEPGSVASSPVNKTGLPISDEVMTFTAMANRAATAADWNDMWCFRKALEITNIAFNIECITSDAYQEKVSLAFATSTLPDVFLSAQNIPQSDLISYANQGLIVPLEGYLEEYGPLIAQRYNEYPSVKKSLTCPDGSIYMLTGFGVMLREFSLCRFWLNTQWVEDLGMTIPTTLDEFYEVCKGIKENDVNGNGDPNDEIPISGIFNKSYAFDAPLLAAFGYVGHSSTNRIQTVDDKVIYVPTEPLYEEYLKYFNKLYTDGLVDPEYFSQTEEQYLAKGSQMLYGTIGYGAEWLVVKNEEQYVQYNSIPPMTSEYNSTQMWPARDVLWYGGIAVTNVCEYPEAIVRFIDWAYTSEGSMILQFGPEQGTYDGGEGGLKLITQDGITGFEAAWPEKYSSYNEFRTAEITPMSLPYVSLPDIQPLGYYYVALNPQQRRLTNAIEGSYAPYYKVPFPKVMMSDEETAQISTILTDLKPYVEQMEAKFMTGEESFDNYSAFVQGCKDRGSDDLVAVYQQVYDRWLAGD